MECSPSKQRILDEALRLFAVNGYEATGIEQIANAVGIKKASLYSHFKSKQEILDMLIQEIEKRYEDYSELVQKECETLTLDCTESVESIADDIFKSVIKQFEFLIEDSFFKMARNFLTIEQFRNPRLASLQNKCEYIDALNYHKILIGYLVKNGILQDKGIEIMAYELFSPIYVQFYYIQRNPQGSDEAMQIIKKHIYHFFKIYSQ